MSYFGKLTFGEAIAQGLFSSIVKWSKIGYVPIGATTDTDVWSYGGTIAVIPLPTAAASMRVKTANAGDEGTAIKGDATGDTVTSDAGGTTTTLVDADVDFTAATAVAVGDCVILDPHGTSPEWGFVTGVDTHTLTLAGGFSRGGSGASRKYAVIDYSSQAGCHAVLIGYLDGSYAQKSEIVVTNGNVANGVVTINTDLFRINEFRVIATGSSGVPTGAVILGDNATPPTSTTYRSYITAGYTRARNSQYTVPAGKTLWVSAINAGFSSNNANTYARIYTRAGQYSSSDQGINFKTLETAGVNIWYPYSEVVASNGTVVVPLEEPTKIQQKVSLKVSAYASAAGIVTAVLRGYLTTP